MTLNSFSGSRTSPTRASWSRSRRVTLGLLRHSEDFDPDANILEPDLVEPDYDDQAFAEAAAFMPDLDDYEDEPH